MLVRVATAGPRAFECPLATVPLDILVDSAVPVIQIHDLDMVCMDAANNGISFADLDPPPR